MPNTIFISHISEEAHVAARLKTALTRDFLGLFNVFVSSDTESIAAGEEWLRSISRALHASSLFLILCSPLSILRPWINFEAGAAWMKDIPLVPLCHSGLAPRDLPMPLSVRQGLALEKPDGLRRLYTRIASVLGGQAPACSFEDLAREITGSVGANPIDAATAQYLDTDRAIQTRLDEALSHPKFKWRTIERVAVAAGLSVEKAMEMLRADPRVRFARSRRGATIVGFRTRVGT